MWHGCDGGQAIVCIRPSICLCGNVECVCSNHIWHYQQVPLPSLGKEREREREGEKRECIVICSAHNRVHNYDVWPVNWLCFIEHHNRTKSVQQEAQYSFTHHYRKLLSSIVSVLSATNMPLICPMSSLQPHGTIYIYIYIGKCALSKGHHALRWW